jgi:RNA polymerase sigma factor (sigma-70 family)
VKVADWEKALTELLRVRGASLQRYACLLTGNEHEAEDVVQEALLRVFSGPGYRNGSEALGALEAYLRTVMANLVVDSRRRGQRWLRHKVAVPASGGDSVADAGTHRQDARAALACLSPQQRACAILRYYDDLSLPEIAARLGLAEGSVKRYLSDAARRLAPMMREA